MSSAPPFGASIARELNALLGAGTATAELSTLLATAGDQWTRLKITARAGKLPPLPDVVAWPRSAQEVARLVAWAAERELPVVPVGGRSGTSGASVPLRGGIALSTARLAGAPNIDLARRLVEVEAGVLGLRLSEALSASGATLGHAPDDLEQATVGGWMAMRSSSEASSCSGSIEDVVSSLEAVDGVGQLLRTVDGPSAGLDLQQLLLGSEGTLCVFTAARLRIDSTPSATWARAVRMTSMERGVEALRRLVRAGLRPSRAVLLDPLEAMLDTRAHPATSRLPAPLRWILQAGTGEALRLGLRTPWLLNGLIETLPASPLLLLSFGMSGLRAQGDVDDLGHEALRVVAGPGTGGEDLGPQPLDRRLTSRTRLGGRRRALERAGAFVDVLDVAATWERVPALLGAMRRAAAGTALVLLRAQSPTLEGCAVELTLVGLGGPEAVDDATPQEVFDPGEELLTRLHAAELRHESCVNQVLEAAADAGATLSHHRGIGLQRQLFLPREHGEGMRQLRALKKAFDPRGILNPGKLLL